MCGEGNRKERLTQTASRWTMERSEAIELRGRVPCAAVLEKAGFAVDLKESTRRAVKYRRGAEIIVVIHDGIGWFDPLSEAKGDVFSLMKHLNGLSFPEARDEVAALVGFVPSQPLCQRSPRQRKPEISLPERWRTRRKPWRSSDTWRYLRDERNLPETVLRAANGSDLLREGPRGSMWAAHRDDRGDVTGWEERGPEWRGFSTGGAKVLFRFGPADAVRICVTEAAIDAMSLRALERVRPDSIYVSTGGGWSPATDMAIRTLAARSGAFLIAATDNNPQGDRYAGRLQAVADEADCAFERLRPREDDWNEELKAWSGEDEEGAEKREGETRLPHARRSRQG